MKDNVSVQELVCTIELISIEELCTSVRKHYNAKYFSSWVIFTSG